MSREACWTVVGVVWDEKVVGRKECGRRSQLLQGWRNEQTSHEGSICLLFHHPHRTFADLVLMGVVDISISGMWRVEKLEFLTEVFRTTSQSTC